MRKIPRIASEYLRRYRRHKVWQRVVAAVASVVVFCTTYALILPAITMSVDELEEHGDEYGIKTGQTAAEAAALGVVHVHSDACYETRLVLDCPFEVHQHTAACYEDGDEEGEPICGYADFVVHTHDAYCYDTDGTLVCTLTDEYPAAHTHDASCYAEAVELHTPNTGEAAVTTTPANTESKAEDEAKEADDHSEKSPDSDKQDADDEKDLEQDPGKDPEEDTAPGEDETFTPAILSDSASDSTGDSTGDSLTPAEPEAPGESNLNLTALAYEAAEPVVLENDVDDTENGLIEEGAEEEAAPEPLCGKKEAVLHTHTDEPDSDGNSCWNTADELVCGKVEVQAHQHDESCLREEQVLVCGFAAAAGEESAAAVSEEDSAAGAGPRRAGAKRASEDEEAACEHEWKNGVCTVCETACTHAEFEEGVCTACGLRRASATVGEYSTTITVLGVPEGASVEATEIDTDDDDDAAADVCWNAIWQQEDSDKLGPVGAYEIAVLDNGSAWQPETGTSVDVKIAMPEGFDSTLRGATIYVLHVHDGDVERLNATYDSVSNSVSFTTASFSTFVLAADASTISEESDFAPMTVDADGYIQVTNENYGKTITLDNSETETSGDTVYYQLQQNIEGAVWTTYGNIVIDLNGFVLCGSGNGPVIKHESGLLTIKDSQADLDDTQKTPHYGTRDEATYKWTWRGTKYDNARNPASDDITLLGGIITGGNERGGGIIVEGGSLLVTGGTFAGNQASQAGGGIRCVQGYTKKTTATDVDYTFRMTGGTVCYNFSTANGGGIYLCGTCFIEGGTIYKNYAALYGGGIRVTSEFDTNFTMTSGVIEENYAGAQGGGIEISMGHAGNSENPSATQAVTATISGGILRNNTAGADGGAFSMSENPNQDGQTNVTVSLTINNKDVEISENTAGGNGGGIYLEYGAFYLKSGTFRKNTATYGGGAYVTKAASATNVEVKLTGGTVESNTAQNGGGLYVNGGTVTISDGVVSGNAANYDKTNEYSGNGGGLYTDGGSVTIDGGTVTGNTAQKNGGGFYVHSGDVTMNGGLVDSNTADNNGGGIAVVGADVKNIETVLATNAKGGITVSNNTAKGNGGGIYVQYGKFKLEQATISGNKACNWIYLDSPELGNGGGVYVRSGELHLDGGTVKSNQCSRFGGGIYVYADEYTEVAVPFVLSGGTVTENVAGQCGGGVTAYTSAMLIEGNVEIEGNTAVNGGGIYAREGAALTMTGGSIQNNKAVSLASYEKLSNTANTANTVEEMFGYIHRDAKYYAGTSGGMQNFTSLIFQTSDVGANTDNGGNGGGVFVHNSIVDLKDSVISGNTADRNGGGVYALHVGTSGTGGSDKPMSLTLEGGDIRNNTAQWHGGGVAMFAMSCDYEPTANGDEVTWSSAVTHPEEDGHAHAQATISGSDMQIEGNTAQNGGAFYVGGGKLKVKGGIIMGNQAEGTPASDVTTAYNPDNNVGVGGGLYVYRTAQLNLVVTKDESGTSGNLGVFSNTAVFAANDVYCSPASTSTISLPNVKDMDLTRYGHVIGKAINWYEDFPNGDTEYGSRGDKTTVAEATGTALDKGARYVTPTADNDDETRTNVVFTVEADKNARTVTGYECLTLGYTLTRVNLTVGQTVIGGSAETFEFAVTIEGQAVTTDTDTSTCLIFSPDNSTMTEDEQANIKYKVTDDGATTGTATLTFTLRSGQYVTLYGIPISAKVTITETNTGQYDVAYTGSNVADANGNTGTVAATGETITVQMLARNGEVDCTNTLKGYSLPQTGGSGTWQYTRYGLALMALAAGGALGGKRRRKRRARKGAGAR